MHHPSTTAMLCSRPVFLLILLGDKPNRSSMNGALSEATAELETASYRNFI